MTPLNPPSKRRRLESAASTLSKPFKSPLRRPPPPPQETPRPSSTSTAINPDIKKEPHPSSTPIPTPNPANPLSSPTLTTPRTRPPTQADPILSNLQKTQRTLQSRLSSLRSDLDTLNQAARIESTARDSELEALIARWRSVSQDAADEVFVGARDRVGRMGGTKAWNERARSSAAAKWEEEVEVEGWVGKGGVEEREREKMAERELEEEDEEFTMEFMLKTLNIDPKVIGFDPVGHRWIRG